MCSVELVILVPRPHPHLCWRTHSLQTLFSLQVLSVVYSHRAQLAVLTQGSTCYTHTGLNLLYSHRAQLSYNYCTVVFNTLSRHKPSSDSLSSIPLHLASSHCGPSHSISVSYAFQSPLTVTLWLLCCSPVAVCVNFADYLHIHCNLDLASFPVALQ